MSVCYSITKQVSKLSGKTHYYAAPQILGTKTTRELGRMVAAKTTVTLPDVYAVLTATSEAVIEILQNGYQLDLEGIGRLRVALKSRNADSRDEFKSTNIIDARVRLLPSRELKNIYDGMEFEFVPTRKQQDVAKAASKAGQTLEATDGDTD